MRHVLILAVIGLGLGIDPSSASPPAATYQGVPSRSRLLANGFTRYGKDGNDLWQPRFEWRQRWPGIYSFDDAWDIWVTMGGS